MDSWRTAIATSDDGHIWNRDYKVTALRKRSGFTQTIFLLHQPRRPACWTPSWSGWLIMAPGFFLRDRSIDGFRRPAVPIGRRGAGDPYYRRRTRRRWIGVHAPGNTAPRAWDTAFTVVTLAPPFSLPWRGEWPFREAHRLMEALEQFMRGAVNPLPMNIDGALAAVLYDIGFPPAFGKLVFIIGRAAGLSTDVAEEYAREKAMRIRIPVTYNGPPFREIE